MIHLIFLNLNLSGNWKWTSNKTLHIWVHSHPSRRQKRAVQVAWPAINTVRMSSLLEGYGYGKLPAKSSRILISKCKITLPKKRFSRVEKSKNPFGTCWFLGHQLDEKNPDLEWLGLNFYVQITTSFWIPSPFPFPFCTPPKWKAPWATHLIGLQLCSAGLVSAQIYDELQQGSARTPT